MHDGTYSAVLFIYLHTAQRTSPLFRPQIKIDNIGAVKGLVKDFDFIRVLAFNHSVHILRILPFVPYLLPVNIFVYETVKNM
jgi:hypothetical protein